MDEISIKTILIGVSIFVTLVIFTVFFLVFGQMRTLYSDVNDIDTSIKSRVDNVYDKYNGAKQNGVDLVNAIRKYEDYDLVRVEYIHEGYDSSPVLLEDEALADFLNEKMLEDNDYKYEHIFSVVVEKEDNIEVIKFIGI